MSTPPDQMAAFAARLPQAEFFELDAGRLSNLEQPEAFTAALARHLEAC